MAETLSPPLFREPLVERGPLTMSANWQRWLSAFWQQAGAGGPPGPAGPQGPQGVPGPVPSPLPVASGGTGATDAGTARSNLGLGTLAVQNADYVAITGGAISTTSLSQVYVPAGVTTFVHEVGFGRAPAAGYSLAAQYQSHFASDITVVGRISSYAGVTALNYAGNDATGIYSTFTAAGGTNRWFIYHVGDAPSYLGGSLQVGGAITGGSAQLTQLGLGIASAGHPLQIFYNPITVYGIMIQPNAESGARFAMYFTNANATGVGSIMTTATGTAYNTTSDVRLKCAIAPLRGALDVVQALKPIAHRWTVDDSPGVGFLAHEVQAVVDGVVIGERDAVDSEGRIMPQQIDYSKLVPWLIGAVQTLAGRVEVLEGHA